MTREEHDAILRNKIYKVNTLYMIKERWYPENVPFKENGEVDFEQFSILWEKELEKRYDATIESMLASETYDVYASDGRTPNVDKEIAFLTGKSNNDEVSMHHSK